MGGDPITFAGSDHGFAPQWFAVNANKVLNDATVGGVSLHASGAGTSNCSAVGGAPVARPRHPSRPTTSPRRAGPAGRSRSTSTRTGSGTPVSRRRRRFPTYAEVRTAVANAFEPDRPALGQKVVLKVMMKEELRNVDGSDSLHPNRSGDVVVVSKPPYQWDAPTANKTIEVSHFFGQHGYLPDTVDLKNNINMHATFVLGGPGVKKKDNVKGIRAIDVAPTLSFLMDIPGPQNARGRILLRRGQGRRAPPRGDDPRHQRLPRPADPADRGR